MPAKQGRKLEEVAGEIVNHLLAEDGVAGEESREVQIGHSILSLVSRMQSSLPNIQPEMQRQLTELRALGNTLLRLHQNPSAEQAPHNETPVQ